MHYFSPVDKVELLEIIRSKQTSDKTICSAVNVGLRQGKLIIVVNDGPGFYITRLLVFTIIEIFYLLQEGLTPSDIDKATKIFGFHVGLATLLDEYGIDIFSNVVYQLKKVFDERLANSSICNTIQIFIKNNLLGKKSKQGLYVYHDNGNKTTNPKLKELLKDFALHSQDMYLDYVY